MTRTIETVPTVRSSTGTSVWTIDPSHTEIGFSVKHLMIANVRGRFGSVKGEITVDDNDFSRSTVEARIDAASIDTREEKRDAHLRSPDFFDVATFPFITFESQSVQRSDDGRLRISGLLTIRDVTRTIVLEGREEGRGRDPWGGERIAFSATTIIDRRDFGLTWNQALETGGVLVGNDIRITLEVEATKTA
jgi:polyisoprenoid-binding protein YceI